MDDLDELVGQVRSALHERYPELTDAWELDLSFMNSRPGRNLRAIAAAGVVSLAVAILAVGLVAVRGHEHSRSSAAAVHSASRPLPRAASPSGVLSAPVWARRCLPAAGTPVPSLIGLDLSGTRGRLTAGHFSIKIVARRNGQCVIDPLNLYDHPVAVAVDDHDRVLFAEHYRSA